MMKVIVVSYDVCKYDHEIENEIESRYEIESFEVKEISNYKAREMGFDVVDPYGEYLVLKLANGGIAIFRNSFCDMFKDYAATARARAAANT